MNNNSNNWDESKHPRDDEGKFTFKGQGTSNPNDGNAVWERRANTFYPDMEDKKKSKGGVLTGGAAPIETKKEETLNSVKKNIDNDFKNYFDGAFNDYKSLEDPYSALWYTLGAFCTNFLEMVDADTIGADKYFHARANFDAAQQGLVGSLVAKIISDIREYRDKSANINKKKLTEEESNEDIKQDQAANERGRELGRKYPTDSAYERLQEFIPNGFPERYRKI